MDLNKSIIEYTAEELIAIACFKKCQELVDYLEEIMDNFFKEYPEIKREFEKEMKDSKEIECNEAILPVDKVAKILHQVIMDNQELFC